MAEGCVQGAEALSRLNCGLDVMSRAVARKKIYSGKTTSHLTGLSDIACQAAGGIFG